MIFPNSSDFVIIASIITIVVIFSLLISFVEKGKQGKVKKFNDAYSDVNKNNKKNRKRQDLKKCTLIGRTVKGNLFIPNGAKHIFVCGTTGSGKTVALSNFIKSGIENNFPMLIIDGKGDIGANSMLDIISKFKQDRKVYIINLADIENSDKYNPFKNTTPTVIKDMLINMTDWTEPHYKLNTDRYLLRLIELMQKSDITLSLASIVNHIAVDNFKEMSAKLLKAEAITKEYHLQNMEIAKESGTIAQTAVARFSGIIESEIGKVFDDNGVDIITALKENAIILFVLNPLLYPELSPLIGNLIVIDSKKAVAELFGGNISRLFFIMDEINVYASKSLLDLVNKSRSANVTCILATQSLSDLDASTESGAYFKEQIIENCNNYIIMRQNSATNAEQWANIIGTKKNMEMTYQVNSDKANDPATGVASARVVQEYLFHPNEIKDLEQGQAIYVNKDHKEKERFKVNKPF